MPQFDVSTFSSQIFWLLICFFVLTVAVRKVFVPRIMSILDQREAQMREAVDNALQLNAELQELLEHKKQQQEHAEQQAQEIIMSAIKEMEEKRERQVQRTDQEIRESLQEFQRSLDRQKKSTLEQLEPIVKQCVEEFLTQTLSTSSTKPSRKKARAS